MSAPEDHSTAPPAARADDEPRAAAVAGAATVDPAEVDVDPAQVAEWLARDPELQVVDVREPYERKAGYIDGSRHIQLVELPSRAAELDRERAIVFYCRVGTRSRMAAQALRAAGARAHSMSGGLSRWAAEARPLAPADGYVADH